MDPRINTGIEEILRTAHTVAVVGLSGNPSRTSYGIAVTLQAYGYEVIPVNPSIPEWNGLKSWPDLRSVPRHIDIVNVFRRSEFVAAIVDEAIEVGAGVLWTQLDVVDEAAALRALSNGMRVIMNRCIAMELAPR